jgi:acyl-CoA synthetase (AMP-forming)/AMP-acid ligase II
MEHSDAHCDKLEQLITAQATRQPNRVALWWQGRATTYTYLNKRVHALAGRLASAGNVGDRVAVLAWNCPEFLELIYAVPASGKILVPLNARLSPTELVYQLQSAGVSSLFGDPELLGPLLREDSFPRHITVIDMQAGYESWLGSGPMAPLPQTEPTDPVWILFTSGSTGRPKGAVLTHQSFLAGLRSAALGRPVAATDRYLYPFPLFHVAAHNVLLQHQHGAAVVLSRSFDPLATLLACRELQVTTMSLAPTMIAMLLDHPEFSPDDLRSVRTIGYGASAMPETLLKRLLEETSVGLCQSYGMTELSGSVAFLTVEDHRLAAAARPELLLSVGKPLPSVQVRLVSPVGTPVAVGASGEIVVRAAQCMREYWDQPEASSQAIVDGWLHTGDIGRFDASGYLYIVDRKKDMIISGGENVASREVEEVLRRHPEVRDCAVIGLPDPKWGEVICAVVQLRGEANDRELTDFCRRQLAAYKTPRRWLRVSVLPLNAAGKIDKPALRRAHASRH